MTLKISIVIPTFNEEKNIAQCLDSIFSQDYSKKNLEVFVVDDYSTDATVEIAKKYPVKLLFSGKKHGEISKMIGFKAATGEYAMYLDADIELRGKDWITRMIKPLVEDKGIIGSFTKYYSQENTPAIERYLNFDPLQRDSIYQYFSSSIDSVIKKGKVGYFVCEYGLDKIPPAGLCLYRREKLMRLIKDYDMFLELDFLVLLVKNGFNKFAYVPDAGLYHKHVKSLPELVRKRVYNLEKVYLARHKRLYKWFDIRENFFKIAIWIIYANLFIPSFFVGIYKTIKHKDMAGMYEPLINLLITDRLVLSFLVSSRGMNLLFSK